jgi:hypothetical protein
LNFPGYEQDTPHPIFNKNATHDDLTTVDPHNYFLSRIFKKVTMKLAIATLLAGSAAAFAPAAKTASSSVLSMGFENELGVIAPTGFFDPFKLSMNIDAPTFDRYRTAELKHGRVAQLAVLGYVVPEFYRFDFDISPGVACADVPNGLAAISAIPALGWAQIILLIGFVDYTGKLGDFDIGKPNLEASEIQKRQLQELQHGRIAMLATAELFRHDSSVTDGMDHLITGLPFLY